MNLKFVRKLAIAAAIPLALTSVVACGSDDGDGDSDAKGSGTKVTVVSQQFTEADIFTELYAALLDDAGFDVTVKKLGGRDVYLQPLIDGDVQISADYLASMANALNQKANAGSPDVATSDVAETLAAFNKVAEPLGLTALEPAKAQDANAFAVTKEFAEENDLTTLSDLGESGLTVDVGGAPECSDRQDCLLGLKDKYGIKVGKFSDTGFGSQQTKEDLVAGTTQVGVVGTSDATLEKFDLVLLEDDLNIRSADNLVPVVNSEWLKANPEAEEALAPLASVLTTEDLVALNSAVDNDREKPADVAKAYLEDKGLI